MSLHLYVHAIINNVVMYVFQLPILRQLGPLQVFCVWRFRNL